MATKKKIRLILTVLLSLSAALPVAATDYETANDRSLPAAPTNLVAEPGQGAATLRWDNPYAPLDAWQYRQNAGDWQDMPNDGADPDEYQVIGLTNGTTYTFEVRAHNAAGWGPASNTAAVTLNAAPRITGLESVAFAENSQGPVATYAAHDAQGDPITWSLAGRDAGAFTFTIDAEPPAMTLLFRAVPDYERPADVPPTDNDYQVSVVATDPGQPALATHYPVRVTVVNVAEASPRPEIAPPEQMRSTSQAEYVGRMVWAVITFYKDIVGWAWRGVVNHVRDVFTAGQRAQSEANAPVPDAPEVSVYSGAWSALETSGRVQVSVRKPASNSSGLTGYEYQLYEGEDRLLDWTSAGVDATTLAGLDPGAVSSFAVGGLLHGQPYAVVVRAVNEVGASKPVWAMATPGRIFAPTPLQAVAGDGWVALTWAAAATEGPVLTRYEVRWRPIWGGWSAWEPVAEGASARGQTIEGLENGVEYAFEVRAANPASAGPVAQIAARPSTPTTSAL